MAAHVSLIPGTCILEYSFSHDVDLSQYQACIVQGKKLADQIPDGPIYALVDLECLRTTPYNFLQATRELRIRPPRLEGVAFIRANAFHQMLARMTIRLLRNREIQMAFCDTRDEALRTLDLIMCQAPIEPEMASHCA